MFFLISVRIFKLCCRKGKYNVKFFGSVLKRGKERGFLEFVDGLVFQDNYWIENEYRVEKIIEVLEIICGRFIEQGVNFYFDILIRQFYYLQDIK